MDGDHDRVVSGRRPWDVAGEGREPLWLATTVATAAGAPA